MVITGGGSSAALIAALQGPGVTITSVTISGYNPTSPCSDWLEPGFSAFQGPPYNSWGTFTNASNVYGIPGPGIVISTGKVWPYVDGPVGGEFQDGTALAQAPPPPPITVCPNPPTSAQAALLDIVISQSPYPGAVGHYNDCTEIDVAFTLTGGHDTVHLNYVYGSNEYFDFSGNSGFADPFGIFLNGVNVAKAQGFSLTVANPSITTIPGTTLNGVANPGGVPLLTYSAKIGAGASGVFKFIIADQGDSALDSLAWLSGLSGSGGVSGTIIQMVGWKLYQQDPCAEENPEPALEMPPVKRAV